MKRWIKLTGLVATVALCATFSQANEISLEITRISVDDNVYTPFYRVYTEREHSMGSAQRWIRFAVEYSTAGDWIDELTINHLLIFHPHNSPTPIVMGEEVTYVHVGPGRHYSYVYIHPNCVKRFRPRASKIDSAVEIIINGNVVASMVTGRTFGDNWPLQYEISNHLLRETETPFQFLNYDFKEITKRQHPE